MPATSPDLIDQLSARGFIHQCTDLVGLRQALNQGPQTFYLGFDATADSLHVGHLQALMLMRHLQRAGHQPILLIGGATTRIGDPSFRDSSRPVLTEAQIQQNIAGITGCFARYIELGDAPNAGRVVDNADWLDGIGYLQFLNEVGRHFSINRLLTFDAVRNRLDREHSLSFQEFGYTLLQAHDFTELARRHNCTLQLGGADQWANIINGVELGRRQGCQPLFGLTMPLLTTRDGRKMGKSAAGAVWLNGDKLSPYDFWQFWRNCDDADVGRFLALFSELPLDEVARLSALEGAELNQAKIILAAELFVGSTAETALPALNIDPQRLDGNVSLLQLLLEHKLQTSGSAIRRLTAGGGLRLNGEVLNDAELKLTIAHLGARISLGKKRHYQLQAQ
ncbi:tyrosine--tRNA ligase [Pseudomonas guineae]|uniref:tyrosine--tRNA ligase n=1 Tax=Pseudomonas guineae TaxID=425504 RepID=UPI0030EE06DA